MSVLQALQLLKFVKGVTKVYTPWNPTPNRYYSWLVTVNEGGGPINFTLGIYKKEFANIFSCHGYFTCYLLGKRWSIFLDKKNTG